MKELLIDKSKTIQIPVIIGNRKDLSDKGFQKDEVYAPILVKDMVSGAFANEYPKAVFIDTDELKDMEPAEFFSLIAYAMRFGMENSANLYMYIINHLYELCDLDLDALEELFEEIYKVHRKILANKTKEERSKISLLELMGDFYQSYDAFTESDSVAFGCITGAYYSYKKELLSTEDYYEIRDMFVPFGISITQTKYDKKKLYEDFLAFVQKHEKKDDVLYLRKFGKMADAFEASEDEFFNADLFESVYFDEFDNE